MQVADHEANLHDILLQTKGTSVSWLRIAVRGLESDVLARLIQRNHYFEERMQQIVQDEYL